MRKILAFALSLLLIAAPAVAQTTGGYSSQIANVSGGSTKVTVNSPPNDVLLGPTTISSPADQTVNSQGAGAVGLQITGTCTSLSGLVRASVDGSNYFNVPSFNSNTGTAVPAGTAITATGSWFIPAAGWPNIQFHPTALTASCTFSLNSSAGSIQPLITSSGFTGVDIFAVSGATQSATNPLFVAPVPGTTGGLSVKSFIVANNTTSVAVKASAGEIYGITASSISAATPVFIKTYNIAQGSNTCGSNTPVQREMVPAPGASGGGTNIFYPAGVAYGTAISVCVTAGQADADTTSPAATSYIVNVYYK